MMSRSSTWYSRAIRRSDWPRCTTMRRDRGTGVWVITRRSGGRRNVRTLPACGQKRTASQYQRRDQCLVEIHRSRPPATRVILRGPCCPFTALIARSPEPPGPLRVRVRPTRISGRRTKPHLELASPRAHQHPTAPARLTESSSVLVAPRPRAHWGGEHSPCWDGREVGPRRWPSNRRSPRQTSPCPRRRRGS
jgi:hypothetical protein